MAVEEPPSNNATSKLASGGSTLLLIRSYEEARHVFAISLSVNLLIVVLGILVNATICYVMLRGKRYKRNSSNFFITHLSVVEMVYRLLVFPLVIYFAVPSSGINTFQCKVASFLSKTSASAIFVSLVAIATDRYQSIVYPLKALKSKEKPRLLWLVWLYAAIVSSPSIISVKGIPALEIPGAKGMDCEDCADKKLCDIPQNPLGQSSTTLYFLLAFITPLTVISVLYAKVAIFLRHRGNSGMMNQVAAKSKSKAVRMLIVTVFGYVLSLGPAVVFAMVRSYGALNGTSFGVMLLVSGIVDFTSYTSSLGNPLIYAYYNGDFRKDLLRIFRKGNRQKVNSYMVTFTNSNTSK